MNGPQELMFELHLTFSRAFHNAQARNLVNIYSSAFMNLLYQPNRSLLVESVHGN